MVEELIIREKTKQAIMAFAGEEFSEKDKKDPKVQAQVNETAQQVVNKLKKVYSEYIEFAKAMNPGEDDESLDAQQLCVLGFVTSDVVKDTQRKASEPQICKMAIIQRREGEPFSTGKVGKPKVRAIYQVPGLTGNENDGWEFGELRPGKDIAVEDRDGIGKDLYNKTEVNGVYDIELAVFRGRDKVIVPLLTNNSINTLKVTEEKISPNTVIAALRKTFGEPLEMQLVLDNPSEYISNKKRLIVGEVVGKPIRRINEETGGRWGRCNIMTGGIKNKKKFMEKEGGISVNAYYSQIRNGTGAIIAIVGAIFPLRVDGGEIKQDVFGEINVRDFDVDGFIYAIKSKPYIDEPKNGDDGAFEKEKLTGDDKDKEPEKPPVAFT